MSVPTRIILRAAAVCVLVVGTAGWVFPATAASVAGPWALPMLSMVAVLLALWLAADWPVLRGLLAVLGLTLLLGWNSLSATSTSHFVGACLGVLTTVLIGESVRTPHRLRAATMVFLTSALVTLVLGLIGAPVRTGSIVDAILPVAVPPVQLGLAGLQNGIVNPNALAAAVLLVIPVGLAVLVLGSRERRDWWLLWPLSAAVVAIGALTLVICDSRTAWLAIWLTVVGFLVRPSGAPWWRWAAGAVVVAPAMLAIYSATALSQEAFLGAAGDFWRSAADRVYIVAQGVEHFRESPWLGIGVNEFRTVFRPNPSAAAHAHNTILQTALDVGIVGSAAYWGVLAFLLGRAGRIGRSVTGVPQLNRSVAIGSALSLILVSLFGLTDAVPLGARIGLFQWMAGGLILAAGRTQAGAA